MPPQESGGLTRIQALLKAVSNQVLKGVAFGSYIFSHIAFNNKKGGESQEKIWLHQ